MASRLKDQFFQRPFFERLASEIAKVPGERLELKARMRHATEALGQTLPADFRGGPAHPACRGAALRELDFAGRSIRRHYAGPHVATLLINGREVGSARFSLV